MKCVDFLFLSLSLSSFAGWQKDLNFGFGEHRRNQPGEVSSKGTAGDTKESQGRKEKCNDRSRTLWAVGAGCR